MTTDTTPTDEFPVADCFKAIDQLTHDFVEAVAEAVETQFELEARDVERIANVAMPGFFPFTDGGWYASPFGYLSHVQGTGSHTGLLSAAVEDAESQARIAWMEEHGQESEHDHDLDPWDTEGWTDELREEWFEFEREWLGQFYCVEVRAAYYDTDNSRNQSGEPEVQFVVMLNLDEYGRDGRGVKVAEQNVPVSQLTEERADDLLATFLDLAPALAAIPGEKN